MYLYQIPIIILVSVICIELIIMLIIVSKFGAIVMGILAVIQIVIFQNIWVDVRLKIYL